MRLLSQIIMTCALAFLIGTSDISIEIHAVHAQSNDLELEFKRHQIEQQHNGQSHSSTRVVDLQDNAPHRSAPKLNHTQQRAVDMETKLYQRIDDIRIENIPAKDAFQTLAILADVNMIVDWKAFEKYESIDPTQKVTLRMKRIPLNVAIDLIFRNLSEHAPILEITPDYIDLKPKAIADTRVIWRVYDLSAMRFDVDRRGKRYITTTDHRGQTKIRDRGIEVEFDSDGKDIDDQLNVRIRNNQTQVNNTSRGFVVSDDVVVESPSEKAKRVARMIRNSIESESWQSNGGDHNSIQTFNGKLVINAPLYIHQQIAKIQAIHNGQKNQRPRTVKPAQTPIDPAMRDGVPSPSDR